MIIHNMKEEVVTTANLVWCLGCSCYHRKDYWQRCAMAT